MIRVLGLALGGYLLGSLPTADLLSRAGAIPLPVRRAVSVVLEAMKGALGVALAGDGAGPLAQCLAATAVTCGAAWSLWAGEGLDPRPAAAGALTVVTPVSVPLWGVLWALTFVASGYLTLGTLVATALLPVAVGFMAGWPFGLAILPACLVLLRRHRYALRRVLLGGEPKHHWRREG